MKIGTMFYTPGHVDKAEFLIVATDCENLDHLWKPSPVNIKYRYMRETTTPSGIVRTFYPRTGQGAAPVTVLDLGYDE